MFSHSIDAETELRLLEQHHAQTVFDLADKNREHLREWLPWIDSTTSVADVNLFIKGALEQFAAGDGFHAGIFHEGDLRGCIGCHTIDWANRAVAIGYWLDASHQGKGLVTRACRAVIDHAFDELDLNRVEIRCATGNTKSRRVPERLGFTEEGVLRQSAKLYDRFVDMVIYAMLKEQWLVITPFV